MKQFYTNYMFFKIEVRSTLSEKQGGTGLLLCD